MLMVPISRGDAGPVILGNVLPSPVERRATARAAADNVHAALQRQDPSPSCPVPAPVRRGGRRPPPGSVPYRRRAPVRTWPVASLPAMELRTLEYFVAVAEERSFTRAAARCHVVQPAISQRIRALEKELGEPLFERLPRQVVLTSGGAALLPHARACLAAAAAASLEFADRSGLLSGTLVLGTAGGLEGTSVPRLLGEYHRRYPGVQVRLTGAPSPVLMAQARSGEIDAAVIAEPPGGLPHGLGSRCLLEDRFVAVLPAGTRDPDHPMTLAEAARCPLIGYGSGSGAHAFVRDAFAAQGLQLDIAYATADIALQVTLVAEGIGIALTSYTNPLLRLDQRIVVVPLEPAIRLRKVLAWRLGNRPGPPLRAFLDLLTELPHTTHPTSATAEAPQDPQPAPQD